MSQQITATNIANFIINQNATDLYRHRVQYVQRVSFKDEWKLVVSDKKVVFNPLELNVNKQFYLRVGGVIDLSFCTINTKLCWCALSTGYNAIFTDGTADCDGNWLLARPFIVGEDTCWVRQASVLMIATSFHGDVLSHPELLGWSTLHAPIASVIPCYSSNMEMIVGMRICGQNDTTKTEREMRRTDDAKSNHIGFHEIKEYQITNYRNDFNAFKQTRNYLRKRTRMIGFYVGKNTSLVMMDVFSKVGLDRGDGEYLHNRTLFQTGSFVYAEVFAIHFRFCELLYSTSQNKMRKDFCETFTEEDIFSLVDNGGKTLADSIGYWKSPSTRNQILFLGSTLYLQSWLIAIADDIKDYNRRKVVLQVSSGSVIERIMEFGAGIPEVVKRQRDKPWNAYVEAFRSPQGVPHKTLETTLESNPFPDLNYNPQNRFTGKVRTFFAKQVTQLISSAIKDDTDRYIQQLDGQILVSLQSIHGTVVSPYERNVFSHKITPSAQSTPSSSVFTSYQSQPLQSQHTQSQRHTTRTHFSVEDLFSQQPRQQTKPPSATGMTGLELLHRMQPQQPPQDNGENAINLRSQPQPQPSNPPQSVSALLQSQPPTSVEDVKFNETFSAIQLNIDSTLVSLTGPSQAQQHPSVAPQISDTNIPPINDETINKIFNYCGEENGEHMFSNIASGLILPSSDPDFLYGNMQLIVGGEPGRYSLWQYKNDRKDISTVRMWFYNDLT